MGDFRQVDAWRVAHALTCDVYRATRAFPKDEQFGLVSQLRRAAVSVGANIAEGCGRNNNGDLSRHLAIALGSANELLYLLELSVDLKFLNDQSLGARAERLCRMLFAFRASVARARQRSTNSQ